MFTTLQETTDYFKIHVFYATEYVTSKNKHIDTNFGDIKQHGKTLTLVQTWHKINQV
jgi:hypothetical protein